MVATASSWTGKPEPLMVCPTLTARTSTILRPSVGRVVTVALSTRLSTRPNETLIETRRLPVVARVRRYCR